jgi:hypothetical protein
MPDEREAVDAGHIEAVDVTALETLLSLELAVDVTDISVLADGVPPVAGVVERPGGVVLGEDVV